VSKPTRRKVVDERLARIRCHQLVARFIPAWDGVHSSPAIVELTAAHATVEKELARLSSKHASWAVTLVELAEFVRKYRLPVLDRMRERNGLTTTFGEQTVDEIVR
jgi:hypothetical protein